jgi:hypothetical protein
MPQDLDTQGERKEGLWAVVAGRFLNIVEIAYWTLVYQSVDYNRYFNTNNNLFISIFILYAGLISRILII